MKAIYALLTILLVSLYYCAEQCGSTKPTKASDCHGLAVTDDDKCCYHNYKYFQGGEMQNGTLCKERTKLDFDNMGKIIKSAKGNIETNGGRIDTYEYNCSSQYLYISLLSLMIFLL